MIERDLPAMAKSAGMGMHSILPSTYQRCWMNACYTEVDPQEGIGLCDDCLEMLRSESR